MIFENTFLCTNEISTLSVNSVEGMSYEWDVPANWLISDDGTSVQIQPDLGQTIHILIAHCV